MKGPLLINHSMGPQISLLLFLNIIFHSFFKIIPFDFGPLKSPSLGLGPGPTGTYGSLGLDPRCACAFLCNDTLNWDALCTHISQLSRLMNVLTFTFSYTTCFIRFIHAVWLVITNHALVPAFRARRTHKFINTTSNWNDNLWNQLYYKKYKKINFMDWVIVCMDDFEQKYNWRLD